VAGYDERFTGHYSRLRSLLFFQEVVSSWVIIGLGIILAIFGGTVPSAWCRRCPNGEHRAGDDEKNAQGEDIPLVIQRKQIFLIRKSGATGEGFELHRHHGVGRQW